MVYTTRMETRASDKIEALVLDVSFRNEENGFTVLQVRLDDGRRVAAVGVMPELAGGERVALTGEWSEHPQYGRQIRVTLCEAHAPTTLSGIERYLGSGLLRGVGPATARQIVERFGEDTLDILQYAPERLREISGIGAKRARRIAESFAEQHQMREAMVYLQGYGLSPALSMKIFKCYGARVQSVIRENPYRLVEDIPGVGFKTADRIAAALGIAPDAPERLRAGVCYALSEAMASGRAHLSAARGHPVAGGETAGRGPRKAVQAALDALLLDQALIAREVDEHVAVYLPAPIGRRRRPRAGLLGLMEALPYQSAPDLPERLTVWEQRTGITLNDGQRRAVRAAVTEGVTVVTGGPGTGKTTIIRCILSLLDEQDEVLLAAPTGARPSA